MKKILENFIFLMVILVIGQTLIEEISVLSSFPVSWKNLLIVTGVCFDLIFSIEFVSRLVSSIREKRVKKYLFQEMGWIDFLSSIPLLLLSSGPLFLSYASAESSINAVGLARFMSMLKMTKIVRIARILRLMRFLKLLKNIRFVNSKISQRHTNYLVAMTITVMIFGVMLLGVVGIWSQDDFQNNRRLSYENFLRQSLEVSIQNSTDFSAILPKYLEKDSMVFLAEQGDTPIYSGNIQISVSEWAYLDHVVFKRIHLYYLDSDAMMLQSRFTLSIMILVILLVFSTLFLYSAKFSLEISDTMKVIEKGLNDPDYFLRLKEEEGRDDEVEALAGAYNNVWLPVKLRYKSEIYSQDQDKQSESLLKQMEDIDLESFLKD